jgi:NDP-sugar pyrophosphorylase family protein
MENPMQAVILAGGKGTRLSPFSKVFPKPLVPVGEKPILDMIVRQLRYFGFQRVTLAVGYMAEMIQTYMRNGEQYGMDIDYSFEEEPLGTVGPLAQIMKLDQDFLVMNGDIITNLNYKDLMDFHKEQNAIATIGTYQKNFKIDLGIIQNGNGNLIMDYVEKPTYTFKVSMGVYIFNMDVLQYIEPKKYIDFPDLVKQLLAHGKKVVSYPFDGYWLDIGNHNDYENAVEEFEAIKGRLHID